MRSLLTYLKTALPLVQHWQNQWPEVPSHPSLYLDETRAQDILKDLATRLQDNYPFHHPAYMGQMLKPPHEIALAAYTLTATINPNNHALDGGPATAALEKEAIALLADLFGYQQHLGHLSASGTIANLEAHWVSRQIKGSHKKIAHSKQAHYTHSRMGEVLGVESVQIDVDAQGKMCLVSLETALKTGDVGVIVATMGTTGLGAIDPLAEIIKLARQYDTRVHVDAAYGGFFKCVLKTQDWDALSEVDSIVVDPHKHGLQPYGCGAVLFKDPSVGKLYHHDSPYTYFTSAQLHLGEISLECSRSGAAAAAFWATLQAFPLTQDNGMGAVLSACLAAAQGFANSITNNDNHFRVLVAPELDIVNYFYVGQGLSASAISRESHRIFEAGMASQSLYLAKFVVDKAIAGANHPDIIWDQETITVLRSTFMKPEHETHHLELYNVLLTL
jgi:glutamate/tyrosine decarboxylase-like PLP-dependent enzyme